MQRPSDLPASNHFAGNKLSDLGREYRYNWSICEVQPAFKSQAAAFVKTVLAHKDEYLAVQKAIKVPWYVVAADHMREASCNFTKCLANGDPWNQKTVHVPAGAGPWASWHDSAIWAYEHEGFANLNDWSLETCFYRLESFNGWGYRVGCVKDFQCHKQGSRVGTFTGTYHGSMQDTTPRNASPYLYNGTQFYQKGVSIEDHSFYPDAIDDQLGCMALLKALQAAGEIIFDDLGGTVAQAPEEAISSDRDVLMKLAATVGQESAMKALLDYRDEHLPGHTMRYWATLDFNLKSSVKRLYCFDVKLNTVTRHLAAHGKGSDPNNDGIADSFSNVDGSNKSCLGIAKCGEIYVGEHGPSMRLYGLETTNSNMAHRAIVMHSADYVSDQVVAQQGHCGRSLGCPAVDARDKDFLIQALRDGSLINLWHS